jgi:ABC-type transport system involved in multi-copper enzyme maturation permease subunit
MSPYLAILTDSFRAALASRVLWIVLGLILLFLLALAPIGLRSTLISDFDLSGLSDRNRLIEVWSGALRSEKDVPVRRVALALPENLQQKLLALTSETDTATGAAESADAEQPASAERLADAELVAALNELLGRDDWYDAEVWNSTTRFREQRGLEGLPADQLTAEQRRRLRRLRLEAAMPTALARSQAEDLAITYLGIATPIPIPNDIGVTRERVLEFIKTFLIPTMLKLFLGIGAVFVAILVTAPIIPEMFQEGSLHLLLSKPVRRPLLFMTKYIGGCAFVLVCVTLLVTGLWLILGLRLDLWNHRLLLAIPMFLAMFAIYYSVSAFAGVVWRNATVAIACVMLFWAMSAAVRYVLSGVMEAAAGLQNRVVRVSPGGPDQVVTSTAFGRVQIWDRAERTWSTIIDGSLFQPYQVLGPVRVGDAWFGAQASLQGGPAQRGNVDGPLRKYVPQTGAWESLQGPDLPIGTRQLLPWGNDRLLFVTNSGLFTADPKQFAERKAAASKGLLNEWLSRLTQPVSTTFFVPWEFHAVSLGEPLYVTTFADRDDLLWVDEARVVRLEAHGENRLQAAAMHEIPVDPEDQRGLRRRLIGASSSSVVYVLNGEMTVLNLDDLSVRHQFPIGKLIPTHVSVANDVAVVLGGEGEAVSFDLNEGALRSARWPHRGNISTLAADSSGEVWLAHDLDALSHVNPTDRTIIDAAPSHGGWWVRLYNWVYRPISRYFPQPAELNGPMDRLIAGPQVADRNAEEAAELGVSLSFWRPLIVNLGFTFLMLALGCWYVARQDF